MLLASSTCARGGMHQHGLPPRCCSGWWQPAARAAARGTATGRAQLLLERTPWCLGVAAGSPALPCAAHQCSSPKRAHPGGGGPGRRQCRHGRARGTGTRLAVRHVGGRVHAVCKAWGRHAVVRGLLIACARMPVPSASPIPPRLTGRRSRARWCCRPCIFGQGAAGAEAPVCSAARAAQGPEDRGAAATNSGAPRAGNVQSVVQWGRACRSRLPARWPHRSGGR